MSTVPQHHFGADDVTIGKMSEIGNETFEVTVSLSGHKFQVLYKTDLSAADLKICDSFKERVAQMAAVSLTVKDFYNERNKNRDFSVISSSTEISIKSDNSSKTLQDFIEQKQEKLADNTSYSNADKAKLGRIISQLDTINKGILGLNDAPLGVGEMSIGALAPAAAPAAKPKPVPFNKNPIPSKNANDKKNIARETMLACKHGYINSKNELVNVPIAQCQRVGPINSLGVPSQKIDTRMECLQKDTFACGLHLQEQIEGNPGRKLCVLDMMNAFDPGGGFLNGATAQEEDLCRRSNLYPALEQLLPVDKPLKENEAIIVNAQVFRNTKHEFLDKPVNIDIVGVAGLENRAATNHLSARPRSLDDQEARTTAIITQMLRTMAANGYTDVVLGALSCGAFNNPPEIVAECFRKVLESDEFKGRFASVTFAVLGDAKWRVFDGMVTNRSTPIENPTRKELEKFANYNNMPKNLLANVPGEILTLPEIYGYFETFLQAFSADKKKAGIKGPIPTDCEELCRNIMKSFAEELLKKEKNVDEVYKSHSKELVNLYSRL